MNRSSKRHPLVILGFDAGDPRLLREWSLDGTLSTVGDVLRRGCWGCTSGPELISEHGTWSTLFSGTSRASPRLLLSPAADSGHISPGAGARPACGRRSVLASSETRRQSRDHRRAGYHRAESSAGTPTIRVGNALSLLSAGRPPAEPARSRAAIVRVHRW